MDEYYLIVIFIILEVIAIAGFVVLAFIFFLASLVKNRKVEEITNNALNKMMQQKKFILLPYSKPTANFLKVLDIYNEKHKHDPLWQKLLSQIMQEQVLPKARKFVNKKWYKQYLLLKCYTFYITQEDEKYVIKLLDENLPVLLINATKIITKISKKPIYIAFIYRLSKAHPSLQKIAVLQLAPCEILQTALDEILSKETEPTIISTCFLIIRNASNGPDFYHHVEKAISKQNLELQISAIKTLPFTNQEKAFVKLTQLCEISNWLLRNATVKAFGHIKSNAVIPYLLKALSDDEWWIRVNAAKKLSLHSKQAREQLTIAGSANPDIKKYTDYFLTIESLKKGDHHA